MTEDYSDDALHTVELLDEFYHFNWRLPNDADDLFAFAEAFYGFYWKDEDYILANPERTWLSLLQNYRKHPADYAVIPVDSTVIFIDYRYHKWLTSRFDFQLCQPDRILPPAFPYGFRHKILDADNHPLFALQDTLISELQAAMVEMKQYCLSVGLTEISGQWLVAEYSVSDGQILPLCQLSDTETFLSVSDILLAHLRHFSDTHGEVKRLAFYITIPYHNK